MRVLVAAATTRWNADAVRRGVGALAEASAQGQDAELVLVYVLETPQLMRNYRRTNRSRYLGKGQHDAVVERLREEHRRLADERLGQAERIAEDGGLQPEIRRCEGRYSEVVLAAQSDEAFDAVIVTRADRSGLSRLLFGSEVRRLMRALDAPRVDLVD